MSKPRRASHPLFNARFIVGVAVLLAGVLFTLDNLDLMEVGEIVIWWPVVLILIGLTRLPGRDVGELSFSLTAIVVGLWILLWNLGLIDLEPWLFFWPAVLILIGIHLVTGALRSRTGGGGDAGERVDAFAFMSSVQRRNAADAFQGGELTAIMGSCEVDLRQAGIGDRPAELRVFAFWGGIDIQVPREWRVESRALAILGSYEDTSQAPEGDGAPCLYLSGMAIMGGVDVKN